MFLCLKEVYEGKSFQLLKIEVTYAELQVY